MENPIKIDDLGVPLFLETPIYYVSFVAMPIHVKYSLLAESVPVVKNPVDSED